MEPIKFSYFLYGAAPDPKPGDPGTALYARAWISEYRCLDLRWEQDLGSWVETEYLWRLLSKGDPDLDSIKESELPVGVTHPII